MKSTIALALSVALVACKPSPTASSSPASLPVKSFGTLPDGREASLYTLTNANGLIAEVTNYGATLVSLKTPDRNGNLADITHGFDSVEGYAGPTNPYFGASVGRYGNRIADGKFKLDGKTYELATNNDPGGIPCHLHGGVLGFNKRLWTVKDTPAPGSITFEYVSEDGEEGYPGTLTAVVTYTLTDDDELKWEATATADKPTVLNLVHHSYWNLSGDPTRSINDHVLTLHAAHFLPTTPGLIPTGDLMPVDGTPMDFTQPTPIGKRLEADFEPLRFGGGYDHCWVLDGIEKEGVHKAARLHHPGSGRTMTIETNQPAIQFYGGNFLTPKDFEGENAPGKNGVAYPHRSALCLETENYPDAPNHENFPSAVLRPGETYRHVMVHSFSAE